MTAFARLRVDVSGHLLWEKVYVLDNRIEFASCLQVYAVASTGAHTHSLIHKEQNISKCVFKRIPKHTHMHVEG